MAIVTGLGTSWNLPNYAGELFAADCAQTPLLSMTGGLTGGRQTLSSEFPTAVLFDYPEASQPAISEEASVTAPESTLIVREQETNVVQIHQEVVNLTYMKMSNSGAMSGLNSTAANSVEDEKAFQIQHKLIKIARDVEHSFLNGVYSKATSAAGANQTRGLIELTKSGTTIDAEGAALSKTLLDMLYRQMAENGAYFDNMVMFLPAYQKQALTELYANQFNATMSTRETIGGVSINQIETDFFRMGVVWDRFMPKDTILIADVAHIAPVFQAVPEKGVLFEEPLAKTGASDMIQIYGQIGLAHGPAFLHGSVTNLATE
ncbi:MAG: DUF5309 domain-containing protein [Clostridia bacterium]|nr:DUF5309 domain-containing protein [Clostridia bacterium]